MTNTDNKNAISRNRVKYIFRSRMSIAAATVIALAAAVGWATPSLGTNLFIYCGPTRGNPGQERRDLSDFQLSLRQQQAFKYLKPSAAHGRQIDVIDMSVRDHYDFGETGGISAQLLRMWRSIYAHNHPNDPKNRIATLQILDEQGKVVIGIAPPECTSL